jgi:hypothetical protein
MLVRFLYSANSGFSPIFFSSIGIPETFKIKMAIAMAKNIGRAIKYSFMNILFI